MTQSTILEALLARRDPAYQAFQARLIPTLPSERIIGVRMPALRSLAKALDGTPEATAFLQILPHNYYEENNLHGLLLCSLSEYEETVTECNRFLPFVDNWATCDLLHPKAFRTHPAPLPAQIRQWLDDPHPYTIRFGLNILLANYLEDTFSPLYLEWAAQICSEEYYVNMMIAWYFATALAKQPDATLPYLTGNRLSPWVHNKTIQKAIESYRIAPEQKDFLRTLRRKSF